MSTLGVILLLGLVTLSVGHKKAKSKSTSEESVEEVCPVPHPLTPGELARTHGRLRWLIRIDWGL